MRNILWGGGSMTMRSTATINIPFNVENVKKCRCPVCPVQHNSQCTKDKLSKLNEALKESPLNPKNIPGQYCSQGTATFSDIDTKQTCICDTCQVFSEYQMEKGEPVGTYCRDGKAHNK
jgi:hypothetical protein